MPNKGYIDYGEELTKEEIEQNNPVGYSPRPEPKPYQFGDVSGEVIFIVSMATFCFALLMVYLL